MTDVEHSNKLDQSEDVHHDGFIDLGGHAGHLKEKYGITLPDKLPVTFFEMTDGQPSLDQVHVLDYFGQEVRNVISTPISAEDVLTRLADKIKTSDADTFRVRFAERVNSIADTTNKADEAVGEATELLSALSEVIGKIKAKDVPLISPQERQDLVVSLEQQLKLLKALQGRLKGLEASGTISEEQHALLLQIPRQLTEIPLLLDHYRILNKAEIEQDLHYLADELEDVQEKVSRNPSRKNMLKLSEVKGSIDLSRKRVENYELYVQEQQTEPIISAEMAMLVSKFDLLKAGIEEYTMRFSSQEPSVREKIQLILSMPEAQAALNKTLPN